MDSDSAPKNQVSNTFAVQACESGQKLLMLLDRHLHLPPKLLHRWIRTGQVRKNGGRCQPFERVNEGDVIRLPPFAPKMARQSGASPMPNIALPPVAGKCAGITCYVKPAGLPTHGGTGHLDSLASRLQQSFATSPFVPVPAHRLDRETSGLILVAETFLDLKKIQEEIRTRTLLKDYLCWVEGVWEYDGPILLDSMLARLENSVGPKMEVVSGGAAAKFAESLIVPLKVLDKCSLLLVRILTGRTHQIRVQLAKVKHPIVGDVRYGYREDGQSMLLHSTRITLSDGTQFFNLPDWKDIYAVDQIPDLTVVDREAKIAKIVKI